MNQAFFRAIVLSTFLAVPALATAPKDRACGDTLDACDAAAARALMASEGFTLVSAEPLPEMLSATFVALAVSGRPQSGWLSIRAQAALSPAQRAWLNQAGGVLAYDPVKTGIDLLIETPKATIARKFYFEKRDGAGLPFPGDPILIRQKQAADAGIPPREACDDAGAKM